MSDMPTRRAFLIGSVAVAGGMAVGYHFQFDGEPDVGGIETPEGMLTPYVVIDHSGITIITPRAEMGQGIHTSLAALVAEELGVAIEDAKVNHGPASLVYSNKKLSGEQLTGGQTSTQDAFVKMRKAGAAARMMLVEAAAVRLGVDAATLTADNGKVIDRDGNEISYLDLAEDAANITAPADPPLKPREAWTILGKPLQRVDMVQKCTGTAKFAIDLNFPGMLYATVKRNPRLGGKMLGFDKSKAMEMPGVVRVVAIEDGVIVVATNTWHAFRAADKIEFDWGETHYPETTAGHRERITQALDRKSYYRPLDRGNVDAVFESADSIIGEYHVPYLAHAAMEPLNATALLKDGSLEVWAGNQWPTRAVDMGVRLTGLPRSAIKIHTTYMGGGFGRRLELDDVNAAIHAAIALPGRHVRVTYTRAEDFRHDMYRPMASARYRASLSKGKLEALSIDLASPSLRYSSDQRMRTLMNKSWRPPPKRDTFITQGARNQHYKIPNYRVTGYRAPDLLPTGWWRSVGESQNCFFHDCIIDELANELGADPLQMRLSLIEHEPSRNVLESVGEMSGWGSALPEGNARGLAYARSSGAATALVIEISMTERGIRLVNAYAAGDVGIALDKRNIEAQMLGSMLFGLSAAIYGEITVKDSMVEQSNYNDYSLLRMHQVPRFEVRIQESGEKIYGVGESMTPTAAPALGNAIYAATGKRIRELPFSKVFQFV